MKFFRKKDKRKDGGHSSKPSLGFGFGPSAGNGGGFGGDSRPGSYRPFGSPPLGPSNNAGWGNTLHNPSSMPTAASARALASLPPLVLERIFAFVCPHSRDESYDTCEESAIEDACMLCDLRDLAHCVAVSKKWRKEAIKLLYHSIRIDTVHYCEREAQLAERRKRRSHFDRNGEPEDTALARLKLLSRTLREDPVRLGRLVQFLKMPYMLRESCQPDLARTIAVTPDLRYVDLPEGLFADEPSYVTLRLEVQARSLELRKMTYTAGSERSLQDLASGTVWTRLEVLELVRINIDPGVLRQVLGFLGNLRALKISDTMSVGDETLAWSPMLPPFPPLEEFILTEVPNITVEGLKSWLELPEARQALRVLTLNTTGVPVWTLQEILAHLPGLKHLSVIDSVAAAMPGAAYVPLLSSPSLETLHFEITAAVSSPKFTGITPSYYNYLASSLFSGGLANLHALYVRDPNFPDMLLGLPPPTPAFAEGGIARPLSSSAPKSSGFGPKSASHGFLSPVGSPSFAPSPQHLSPFGSPPGSFGHRQQDSLSSIYSTQSTPQQPAWQQPGYNPQRLSSNNPFATAALGVPTGPAGIANLPAKLEVFTKGEDELSWSFAQVNHFSSGRSGGGSASGRPLSSYGLGADVMGGSASGWSSGGGARRSVLVGGAGGGFLVVPSEGLRGAARERNSRASNSGGEDEWPRPKSSTGETKRERRDLWR